MLAMQKVEGSSPFSRSLRSPANRGVFCCSNDANRRCSTGATTRRYQSRGRRSERPGGRRGRCRPWPEPAPRVRSAQVGALFRRPLSDRERSLLDLLLGEEFPGADELRGRARTVRVKGLWKGLPSIVLLEVEDATAPRQPLSIPFPSKQRFEIPIRPRAAINSASAPGRTHRADTQTCRFDRNGAALAEGSAEPSPFSFSMRLSASPAHRKLLVILSQQCSSGGTPSHGLWRLGHVFGSRIAIDRPLHFTRL